MPTSNTEHRPATKIVVPPTPEKIKELYSAYTGAVGAVAHSWNYLQERLGLIFANIIGGEMTVGLAVWYSHESDRAQQKMLKAAIETVRKAEWHGRLPTAAADLVWLVDQASKLSDARNTAIHAPCSLLTHAGGSEIIGTWISGHPRAMRLKGKAILKEFSFCSDCAESLSMFATAAFRSLCFPDEPWPKKPKLPSRQQ